MQKPKARFGVLPRIFVAIVLGVVFGLASPDCGVRALNCFGATFAQFIKFIVPFIILGFVTPAIAETALGFTSESYAIMVAIYMALDGMGTACNLTGDGAIALVVDRFSRPSGEAPSFAPDGCGAINKR